MLHLVCGLFIAVYVGGGNLKAWLPVCVLGFWPVTHVLAVLERVALQDATATLALLAGLGAVSAGVRMFARLQRQSYGPIECYERPAQTQRLDLGG